MDIETSVGWVDARKPNTSRFLEKRANEHWIIGQGSDRFPTHLNQALTEIAMFTDAGILPKISIAQAEPIEFLAKFVAAIATECPVFLANPQWQQTEWQQVFALVKPDLVWGANLPIQELHEIGDRSTHNSSNMWRNCIMIPTGGTSGNIRFAIHTLKTLTASVRGFSDYFKVDVINSFCVLPLYHVSGLMQFIRSFVTGGNFFVSSFQKLDSEQLNELPLEDYFISLVPTQLEKMLSLEAQYLSRFKTVLLGGAPAWDDLLQRARQAQIPLALTYGMTETASQIAALHSEDFLKGNSSNGLVLPHACISIENQTINIKSKSLYLGYYPNLLNSEETTLITDDLGYFDPEGYLHVLGRNSQKIITGGENVFPAEVEAAIRGTNLVSDVCVIGLSDRYWGQAVTALYVPDREVISHRDIASAISDKISKFKQPKYWIPLTSIPRNIQGKANVQQIMTLANEWMKDNLATERSPD